MKWYEVTYNLDGPDARQFTTTFSGEKPEDAVARLKGIMGKNAKLNIKSVVLTRDTDAPTNVGVVVSSPEEEKKEDDVMIAVVEKKPTKLFASKMTPKAASKKAAPQLPAETTEKIIAKQEELKAAKTSKKVTKPLGEKSVKTSLPVLDIEATDFVPKWVSAELRAVRLPKTDDFSWRLYYLTIVEVVGVSWETQDVHTTYTQMLDWAKHNHKHPVGKVLASELRAGFQRDAIARIKYVMGATLKKLAALTPAS